MKCGFIVKHRGFWPTAWLCEALGVSRGGFYAWLTRPRSRRARRDEVLGVMIRASFLQSGRTYGARRVWHDLLAEGEACGLHRIERLMRQQALRARPRRRRVPANAASQSPGIVSPNVLNRQFDASAPNRKWVADFTYLWTAEGWLYIAAVIDLFSRRVVGWSMQATMTAQVGYRCVAHGYLAARQARRGVASLGSRQPVHQPAVPTTPGGPGPCL